MRYREQLAETTMGRWIECTWSLETAAHGDLDLDWAARAGTR